MKPLVLFCPPEHYEALVSPILGPLFTYLHMVRDWSERVAKMTLRLASHKSCKAVPRSVISWPCPDGHAAVPPQQALG